MKLLVGFIASAYSAVGEGSGHIDCPNSSWEATADGSACVPAFGSITITCLATEMVVKFEAGHLYVNVDDQHVDDAASGASVGTCAEVVSGVSGVPGEYELRIPLDSCGTEVTQGAELLSFTNTITGSTDALTVDGIITTERLELDVECTYSNKFEIAVGDIGIEAAGHALGDTTADGDFHPEFDLSSYVDSGYNVESDSTATIIIGEKVYNRVSAGDIPSNIDFVVKQCTAYDAEDTADRSLPGYDILKNGCLDNLVETSQETNLRGDFETAVDFSFNGFTFESTSDTLYLECTIVLCALDENGFFHRTCGFDDSDLATVCLRQGADKALGVTPARPLFRP